VNQLFAPDRLHAALGHNGATSADLAGCGCAASQVNECAV
jgi:hypothetical protein